MNNKKRLICIYNMKYYAVYKGYKTGVYENWDECFEQIKGYSSAMYKKCDNLNDAEYYYKNGVVNQEPKYEDLSKYFIVLKILK